MRIRLPKILPAGFDVVHPDKHITRQQRRHAKIVVEGKEIEILDYLRRMATKLPKMYDRVTKEPIDHVTHLRAIYMVKGITGVNYYIMAIRKVAIEEQGGLVPYHWKRFKIRIYDYSKKVLGIFRRANPAV